MHQSLLCICSNHDMEEKEIGCPNSFTFLPKIFFYHPHNLMGYCILYFMFIGMLDYNHWYHGRENVQITYMADSKKNQPISMKCDWPKKIYTSVISIIYNICMQIFSSILSTSDILMAHHMDWQLFNVTFLFLL